MDLLSQIADATVAANHAATIVQHAAEVPAVDPRCVDDNNKAHARILAMVEAGRASAGHVIERVMTERPQDVIAPARAFSFVPAAGRVDLGFRTSPGANTMVSAPHRMHDHAIDQVAALASMPRDWWRHLVAQGVGADGDNWGPKLLAHSLDQAFDHRGSRHLVRSVEGQVRGVLSDRYRRLDSRPLLEKTLEAFGSVGLMPYRGRWLETRLEIQAISPRVYAPFPGELVAFGLSFRSSDYGDGAVDVRAFMLRPACANGAVTESIMRQTHVGRRIADDDGVSDEAARADANAQALIVRDKIREALAPEKIEARIAQVAAANERELTPARAAERLRKLLTKDESEKAIAQFTSADIVTLPPGQTDLRMSNAISWLANTTKNESRAQHLQEVAGAWLAAH